jgi:hypothetical protein
MVKLVMAFNCAPRHAELRRSGITAPNITLSSIAVSVNLSFRPHFHGQTNSCPLDKKRLVEE